MKANSILLLAVGALGVAVALAWVRLDDLESELAELRLRPPEGDFELADAMGALQRFADKLYFAGQHESWPLAGFYLHEIEETVEAIAEHDVIEEGVALTPLLRSLLSPAVAALEESVEAEDAGAFRQRYPALVDGCNACHQASGHGFVRITVPERSMFENQSYLPLPGAGDR